MPGSVSMAVSVYCKLVFYCDDFVMLSGFNRSCVFLSGNTHDMFFNVNEKTKKAKCMQSNDKRILAAQIRVIGKSCLIT